MKFLISLNFLNISFFSEIGYRLDSFLKERRQNYGPLKEVQKTEENGVIERCRHASPTEYQGASIKRPPDAYWELVARMRSPRYTAFYTHVPPTATNRRLVLAQLAVPRWSVL